MTFLRIPFLIEHLWWLLCTLKKKYSDLKTTCHISRGVSRAAAISKMKYFGIIYPLHLGCCSSPISKKQFLNLKNNHLIVSHHKVLLCVENHSKPNEMEKQRKKSFKISAKTYHSLIRGVAPNPLMKKVRAKYK